MGARLSMNAGEASPPVIESPVSNVDVEEAATPNTRTTVATASSPSVAATASTDKTPYTAELISYEAACRLDPEVQSFDATLQRRTTHVISTLAMDADIRSLSFDSLNEVTGCLLDTNQEVVKIILECRKDVWKNAKLFDLVEEYFESSLQTLDFCAALEKCLRKARDSQLIVQVALHRFEEEVADEADRKGIYSRVLEELRSFKAAGDPFTEEFFRAFQLVYRQQLLMLEKLQLPKQKLNKKLKSVEAWRKISSVIFAATFVAVLICSVVAAAVAAPPVMTALAAATSIAMAPMGKWFYSLWNKYQDALKGQREVISTMQVGTSIAIKDLDNIRVLVDQLKIQIDSLFQAADFAMRDEDAVKFGVEEVKKKLGLFMKSIEDLSEQADRCSRDIRRARTVVLQRIIKHPS